MVKHTKREELIPSAARLLNSLRDLGYEFTNAVADLIDNSVSAGAGRVDITIAFDGPDSWIRVADDGEGMGAWQISEAMRLGSGGRDYGGEELGKFGLGLKTASLSQARSITVASRTHEQRRQIDCRHLDLDEIIQTDRWEVIHPAAGDRPPEVVEPLQNGPGTVVLWTKLDRVLNRQDPFGGWAERQLLQLAERLDMHLGMVFGRFLSGQARRKKPLLITINGTEVEPWDPFCLNQRTEYLPEAQLPVSGSMVRYRPYVLPPRRDFSDEESWARAGGPLQWNRQQGLYIYRADRMIQSGGWSWLRGIDEHIKLARAALEFWPELDEAFEINISKMRSKLPEELRGQLKPMIAFLTKRADDRYRISGRDGRAGPPKLSNKKTITPKGITPRPDFTPTPELTPPRPSNGAPSGNKPSVEVPTPTPANPTPHGGTTGVTFIPDAPTAGQALERAAARAGVEDALFKIRGELSKTDPEVAYDLGW